MNIIIKEVLTRRDLKKFIDFPNRLYTGNPYYVPRLYFDELNTLRRDKNPAFEVCDARFWLAYKDGKIAGRIAAIHDKPSIEKWGNKYLRFGWIDFIDDEEVSQALMREVEKWAKELGMTGIHGPLGFTDMDNEGMLIEGFEEVGTLATLYNYPYYPEHIEKMGFRKDVDWMEFEGKVPESIPEKIALIAEQIKEKFGLRLLKVNKAKELLPYARPLFEVLDTAYSGLYGTVPLTLKQVDAYIKQYFGFIRPGFVSLVLDSSDKVIAFGITMPSFSRALQKCRGRLFPLGFLYILNAFRKNDLADLYLVGVEPEWQGKGINALIIYEIARTFIRNGIKKAETNPELELNYKVQSQWKFFEMRQHKRRRCYLKMLEE